MKIEWLCIVSIYPEWAAGCQLWLWSILRVWEAGVLCVKFKLVTPELTLCACELNLLIETPSNQQKVIIIKAFPLLFINPISDFFHHYLLMRKENPRYSVSTLKFACMRRCIYSYLHLIPDMVVSGQGTPSARMNDIRWEVHHTPFASRYIFFSLFLLLGFVHSRYPLFF